MLELRVTISDITFWSCPLATTGKKSIFPATDVIS